MKILHTSDWHIGRQFHGVSLLDDQRHVLEQVVEYIGAEAVDVVVIAGDIYDRAVPPALAVELLDEVLTRICSELNVPVILISGNHDSAQRLGFGSRQLEQAGLHIISHLSQVTEPVVITAGHESVSFYGIPYCDPAHVRDQFDADVSSYDEAHRFLIERINQVRGKDSSDVLISHCFVDGCDESDSERPLSIGGADRVSWEPLTSFDYVALGHLHSPQYKGEQHIRYSGSILKYSFSEQHQKKGVTLIELPAGGGCKTRHLPLGPLRDMRVVEGALEDIVEKGKVDPGAEDYLLVRLTDTHAILDPMGKLREVYPNVLHLEKIGVFSGESKTAMDREKLKRSELDMFRDFFRQISGRDLSEGQDAAVRQEIESIHKAEEGGL